MEQQPIFLDIKLNVDQINVILATLGKLPYETIAPLMSSIQSQANMQLEALQKVNTEAQNVETTQESSLPPETTVQ